MSSIPFLALINMAWHGDSPKDGKNVRSDSGDGRHLLEKNQEVDASFAWLDSKSRSIRRKGITLRLLKYPKKFKALG